MWILIDLDTKNLESAMGQKLKEQRAEPSATGEFLLLSMLRLKGGTYLYESSDSCCLYKIQTDTHMSSDIHT